MKFKQNMLNQSILLNYQKILNHKVFKRDFKTFEKICLTKKYFLIFVYIELNVELFYSWHHTNHVQNRDEQK